MNQGITYTHIFYIQFCFVHAKVFSCQLVLLPSLSLRLIVIAIAMKIWWSPDILIMVIRTKDPIIRHEYIAFNNNNNPLDHVHNIMKKELQPLCFGDSRFFAVFRYRSRLSCCRFKTQTTATDMDNCAIIFL